MSVKRNFLLMADYNKWMNDSVFTAATRLTQEELKKDTGAFFGSVIGTLNHILVADIIWLKRFATHRHRFSALNRLNSRTASEELNAILFYDLDALKKERGLVDDVICDFIKQLPDNVLESDLSYKNTKGISHKKCFAHLILHFFNHQTHHRGQVSTLLSQFGVDLGMTDLLAKIPDV